MPVIVSGTRDLKSGVKINDGENNSFSCDTAVIARTECGTVLIQFTDKVGDDGRILGFAGTIEGKQGFGADAAQMIAVERVYLAGGANPITASRGTCIMNWSGLLREGGWVTSIYALRVPSLRAMIYKQWLCWKRSRSLLAKGHYG